MMSIYVTFIRIMGDPHKYSDSEKIKKQDFNVFSNDLTKNYLFMVPGSMSLFSPKRLFSNIISKE
jgi:hypothetical protein